MKEICNELYSNQSRSDQMHARKRANIHFKSISFAKYCSVHLFLLCLAQPSCCATCVSPKSSATGFRQSRTPRYCTVPFIANIMTCDVCESHSCVPVQQVWYAPSDCCAPSQYSVWTTYLHGASHKIPK